MAVGTLATSLIIGLALANPRRQDSLGLTTMPRTSIPQIEDGLSADNATAQVGTLASSLWAEVSVSASTRVTLDPALETLRGLVSGWDGYSACPINDSAIDFLDEFLRMSSGLLPSPGISALSSGEPILYWRQGSLYAELEFDADGQVLAFVGESNGRGKSSLISMRDESSIFLLIQQISEIV